MYLLTSVAVCRGASERPGEKEEGVRLALLHSRACAPPPPQMVPQAAFEAPPTPPPSALLAPPSPPSPRPHTIVFHNPCPYHQPLQWLHLHPQSRPSEEQHPHPPPPPSPPLPPLLPPPTNVLKVILPLLSLSLLPHGVVSTVTGPVVPVLGHACERR